MNKLHKKKLNRVIFKIDFEKTYNKVRCPSLLQKQCIKGFFLPKWIKWVEPLYNRRKHMN